MKAIITKSISATNTKPWRVKASADGLPAKFYGFYELEAELIRDGLRANTKNTHCLAAKKYAWQYDWLDDCELVSGGVGNGQFAHVLRAKGGVEGCHLHTPLTLVITLEGGLVQSVNADRPVEGLSVVIVDYDTEGAEEVDEVEQPDGGTASACVTEWGVSPVHPAILKSINEILDA